MKKNITDSENSYLYVRSSRILMASFFMIYIKFIAFQIKFDSKIKYNPEQKRFQDKGEQSNPKPDTDYDLILINITIAMILKLLYKQYLNLFNQFFFSLYLLKQ